MRRSAVVGLVLLAGGLSACAAPVPPGAPEPSAPRSAEASAAVLPGGWRWESYGGVELAVPGDWGWGNGSQRLSQWCVGNSREPIVGRPAASTAAGCLGDGRPAPHTLLANTGPVVAFERTADPDGVRHDGDQTTVRLDGAVVTVNAPAELRGRIVATIRRVGTDSNGCPARHAIAMNPRHRPAPAEVTSVSSVSVCKFEVPQDADPLEPRLVSSLRLDGDAADRAIRAVLQAPVGGGPDRPEECLPEVSYGRDVIVLLVTSAAGPAEIVVRYSGCDHNGFDDGVVVRSLTAAAIGPFIAGPNVVLEYSGSDKTPILHPELPGK